MLIAKIGLLLKADMPLVVALDILARQSKAQEKALILALKNDIIQGASLSQAMQKHPHDFDVMSLALIQSGEATGLLISVCEKLANYHEKTTALKMRLKKALFYPVTVFIMAWLISAGLLLFIVPQFELLFHGIGADLPWLTQKICQIADFMQKKYYLILLIFLLIILIIKIFSKKLTEWLLFLPLIGSLYRKILLSRFAYIMALLLSADIIIIDALDIATRILQQKTYQQALLKIRQQIIMGNRFSTAFTQAKIFPVMFLEFISLGEQTGNLHGLFAKIADYYDTQTEQSLTLGILLIEPIMMLILGVFIGGLMIALYLPIFQLGNVMK